MSNLKFGIEIKIHKEATIGLHVHIVFYLEICDKTPNDFDEKKIRRFVV